VSRQMYTCVRGRFVRAPKGYFRLAPVLIVGTILLALNVSVHSWFSFVNSGVTL